MSSPQPQCTIAAEPAIGARRIRHTRTPTAVAVFDNYWSVTLAFAASLGAHKVPLHFYGKGAGRWSRFCTRHAACPPIEDADSFLEWLRARVRSGEIGRVAPTSDLLAYYLSVLREEFPLDVRRTIAPLPEIERCLIKTRFAAACERIGQPVPMTSAPSDLECAIADAQRIGFPLIMKPKSHLAMGSSERGRLIRNRGELIAHFRPYSVERGQEPIAARYPEIRWPLIQEYVPSSQKCVYSVSGYKDADTGIVVASISVKCQQWPPVIGISTSQLTCNDQCILVKGTSVIDRLLSRGIFEIELLAAGDDLVAIDLNPRAFGFMMLDIAVGNDIPWLWFNSTHAPLDPISAAPNRPIVRARLTIPHFAGRLVSMLLGVRSRDPRATATSPVPNRTISMLGDWADPIPMLISNLRLLRHPGSLVRPYISAARAARDQT